MIDSRVVVSVLVFALAGLPVCAHATTIAEDPFDYTAGSLAGNGSVADPGWAGAWSGDVAVTGAGSLSYSDSSGNQLVTSGNAVQTAPGTVFSYRSLSAPLPTEASDVYISFLMDGYSDVGSKWSGISIYLDNTELFFMGKPGNTNDVGVQVPGQAPILASGSFSDPLFFTIIFQLVTNGTETQALFFINSDLDVPMANGFVGNTFWSGATMNRIRIAGETGIVFDELRIGTTFADVSPYTVAPEPGAILLLGCGLASLAVWLSSARRRPRRARRGLPVAA